MGRKKNDHLLSREEGEGLPNFSNRAMNLFSLGFSQHTFLQIPKMDPIETRQSMFEDPSKGSKATT